MVTSEFAHQPFNILPLLPPKKGLETTKVLKAAIGANRALAELKGKAESLPNQSILFNSIILQEAKASSEIENVVTTNDKIFMAMSANDKQADPQTKEVLRYRQALWLGFRLLQDGKMNTSLFVLLMQMIKESEEGIRSDSGTVIANPKTRKIIYWPPEGEKLIRQLLENLVEYINEEDVQSEISGGAWSRQTPDGRRLFKGTGTHWDSGKQTSRPRGSVLQQAVVRFIH